MNVKLAYKVALYSILIFPGAGYFLLGKRRRAWLCIAITLVCLGFVMFEANFKADIVAAQINRGELGISIESILDALRITPSPFVAWQQVVLYGALIATWAMGIWDSFRLARQYALHRSGNST